MDESIVLVKIEAIKEQVDRIENSLLGMTQAVTAGVKLQVRVDQHRIELDRLSKNNEKIENDFYAFVRTTEERVNLLRQINDKKFEETLHLIPDKLSDRITALEYAQPITKMVNHWIISVGSGLLGAIFMGIVMSYFLFKKVVL